MTAPRDRLFQAFDRSRESKCSGGRCGPSSSGVPQSRDVPNPQSPRDAVDSRRFCMVGEGLELLPTKCAPENAVTNCDLVKYCGERLLEGSDCVLSAEMATPYATCDSSVIDNPISPARGAKCNIPLDCLRDAGGCRERVYFPLLPCWDYWAVQPVNFCYDDPQFSGDGDPLPCDKDTLCGAALVEQYPTSCTLARYNPALRRWESDYYPTEYRGVVLYHQTRNIVVVTPTYWDPEASQWVPYGSWDEGGECCLVELRATLSCLQPTTGSPSNSSGTCDETVPGDCRFAGIPVRLTRAGSNGGLDWVADPIEFNFRGVVLADPPASGLTFVKPTHYNPDTEMWDDGMPFLNFPCAGAVKNLDKVPVLYPNSAVSLEEDDVVYCSLSPTCDFVVVSLICSGDNALPCDCEGA